MNRSARPLLLAASLALLAPGAARGYGGGISGYSGRNGTSCTACHAGGTTPTVTLTGPTSVDAGQTATYQLVVSGGPAIEAGLDVAASGGALATADGSTRLSGGEVTQSDPKPFASGSASFTFEWTAPSSAGTYTLYAAGLSGNGSGIRGDGTGTTTLAVSVGAAPAPACTAGQVQACYTGPAGTLAVGNCKAGTQGCANDAWGACTGQVVPTTETCNGADDDCDGSVDEGCTAPVCADGQTRACYGGRAGTAGVGACRSGAQTCSNGAWGPCAGDVPPAAEACGDALDNDCDGQSDEGCTAFVCAEGQTRSCYGGPAATEGVGTCHAGVQGCANNAWGPCSGEALPAAAEACGDRLDNDCDGQIDEGCPSSASPDCKAGQVRPCYGGPTDTAGIGNCQAGRQTCAGGTWGACLDEIRPTADVCGDGIDNDCNAQIDDCAAAPAGDAADGEPATGCSSARGLDSPVTALFVLAALAGTRRRRYGPTA